MFTPVDSANVFLRLPFFLQKGILSSCVHIKNINNEIYKEFVLRKFQMNQYVEDNDFILYEDIYYVHYSNFEDVITNVFRDELQLDNSGGEYRLLHMSKQRKN